LELEHIEQASLYDVKSFFYRYYHPQNAILCVAGKISEEKTVELCEKWYADIEPTDVGNQNIYLHENPPNQRRFFETTDLSPNNAVFMVWRGPVFSDEKSVDLELFSELLGGSENGPLYQKLVKQSGCFSAAECFYTRGIGEGLFVLYGILNEGVTNEEGEKQLWFVLNNAKEGGFFNENDLKTAKNKATAALLFEKTSLINKAQKLCYFANLGLLRNINSENEQYQRVEMSSLIESAATLKTDNVSVIYYHPKTTHA
jgi:predicted Zn-dependent peptidase